MELNELIMLGACAIQGPRKETLGSYVRAVETATRIWAETLKQDKSGKQYKIMSEEE